MFKVIKNRPNYEVNIEGVVRNVVTGKVLSPSKTDGRSYPAVCLFDGYGNGKMFTIHRLIAKYFIPNPENKPCVDHIDYDRGNFNVNNLRWVTYLENNLHSDCAAKPFRIQKDGEVFEGTNLKRFCEERGLSYKAINNMYRGKSKKSFGYTKA